MQNQVDRLKDQPTFRQRKVLIDLFKEDHPVLKMLRLLPLFKLSDPNMAVIDLARKFIKSRIVDISEIETLPNFDEFLRQYFVLGVKQKPLSELGRRFGFDQPTIATGVLANAIVLYLSSTSRDLEALFYSEEPPSNLYAKNIITKSITIQHRIHSLSSIYVPNSASINNTSRKGTRSYVQTIVNFARFLGLSDTTIQNEFEIDTNEFPKPKLEEN
jgi:hypothetical protein